MSWLVLILPGCLPYEEKPAIEADADVDADVDSDVDADTDADTDIPEGPAVRAQPEAVQAGTIDVGCVHDESVTVESFGDQELQITDLSVAGNGVVLGGVPSLPTGLAAGDTLSLTLTFEPTTDGQISTDLLVASNDPMGDLLVPVEAVAAYVEQTDSFTAPDNPPVDILMAVDQSCSMDATAQNLVSNLGAFLLALDSTNPEWKIGVVDVTNGCIFEEVDPNSPTPLATLATAMQEGEDQSGMDTYSEQLYELMDIALGATTGNGCNTGFLRPNASLHLIVVSDEEEQSPGSGYAASFQSVVPDVTVHGVLGQSGCSISAGGFAFVINATGGTTTDLCTATQTEMTTLGEAIGGNLGGGDQVFELSDTPAPDTIEVRVDGAVFTEWVLGPDDLIVVSEALTSGESVEVSYGLEDACP